MKPNLESHTAKLYFDAGTQMLRFKLGPFIGGAEKAEKHIDGMLDTIKLLQIPHFEKDLQRLKTQIAKASGESPEEYETGIPNPLAAEWNAIAQAIDNAFSQITGERKLLLLDESPVSESLRELSQSCLKTHEQTILHECIRCLETGAYRAAIVMGWNLAYEHVRQWIFQNKARLSKFNSELTSRNRTKTLKYDPIDSYDDFMLLGEHFCIEVAYAAGLWNKQQNQILQNALTDRNHFAHPSLRKVTSYSAAGYIDNLVVNIITAADFKRRIRRAKKA